MLVVPVHERADGPRSPSLPGILGERVRDRLVSSDVRSESGKWTVVYPGLPRGAARVVFLGIGPLEELTEEGWRRFAGAAVRIAEQLDVDHITLYVRPAGDVGANRVAQAAAEG